MPAGRRPDRGRRPVAGRHPPRAAERRASASRPAPASTRARTWAPTATAGAVLTSDDATAGRRCGRSATTAAPGSTRHDLVGMNSRLDTLQAVVLRAKLRRLDAVERAAPGRRARRYDDLLAGVEGVRPPGDAAGQRARVAPVRGAGRRARRVLARLDEAGIGAGIHYPHAGAPPRRLRPTSATAAATSRWPRRRRAEILSLPLFPGITAAQQGRVASRSLTAAVGAQRHRHVTVPTRVRPPARPVRERPGRRRAPASGRGPTCCPAPSSAPTATSATTPSSRAGCASATGSRSRTPCCCSTA